jgi:O-antigen ligase
LISIKYKVVIFFLAVSFLTAVGIDTYRQEIIFSIIPLAFLAGVLLVEHPEYLLYSLMFSIPWSVEYHFDGNLSIDFPDEPFMLLASTAGIIFFIYNRKKLTYKRVHPIVIVILLQFLWTIISTVCSTDVLLSMKYLLAKSWYLLAFVALPIFLLKDEKHLKRSSILFLISTLVAMLVALIRQSTYYWSFEKVNDALTPFFHNHVIYSALLVFTVPIQIAIFQLSKSHRTRIFTGCLICITVGALYFSYSRGSWIALLTGVFSYWLLRKRLLLFGFLVFICFSAAFALWLKDNDRYLKYSNDYKTTIYHSNFEEHLIATYKLKDLSNAERIYRWVAAIQMAKDYSKTGAGPTTFYDQYKSYTVPAFKTYVSDNKEHSTVHNYFLLLLIEQGVMGLVLFIILLVFIFWYAQKVYFQTSERFWKVVAAAIASIIAMECTVNFLSDMIETDKAGSVFYLSIAAIIIADIKTRGKESNSSANIQGISQSISQ